MLWAEKDQQEFLAQKIKLAVKLQLSYFWHYTEMLTVNPVMYTFPHGKDQPDLWGKLERQKQNDRCIYKE